MLPDRSKSDITLLKYPQYIINSKNILEPHAPIVNRSNQSGFVRYKKQMIGTIKKIVIPLNKNIIVIIAPAK
jgi:hypothetical protein